MGFDLFPRNKKLDPFHFGAFSWSWMLDEGLGYILQTGRSREPAGFSFVPDKKGRCPHYNDGFMVSAFQAKAMGMAAKGLARSKKYINEEWEKLTPEQRDEAKKYDFYLKPIRDDFIELANKFSEWAPKSKGFSIK